MLCGADNRQSNHTVPCALYILTGSEQHLQKYFVPESNVAHAAWPSSFYGNMSTSDAQLNSGPSEPRRKPEAKPCGVCEQHSPHFCNGRDVHRQAASQLGCRCSLREGHAQLQQL